MSNQKGLASFHKQREIIGASKVDFWYEQHFFFDMNNNGSCSDFGGWYQMEEKED